MKISYDPEIDALYIRLVEGPHECRTARLNEDVAHNIGVDERLIGIEVLDVSSAIGKHGMANYLVETIPVAPA